MFLTFGKECRLRMFENGLQKRILWPRKDQTTGEWRNLHNKERNDPYSSPTRGLGDQTKEKEMGGASSTWGERRVAYSALVG